jgi:UDP-glucose 4-epimerase
VADSSRIRETLGWEPKFDDLEAMVASAWNWFQAHPEGYK